MTWLHSPFSGKSSHSDDSLIGGRPRLKSSIFSLRTYHLHMLMNKIRHSGENLVDQSFISSNGSEHPTSGRTVTTCGSSALPEPQPLPLPRFQFIQRNDYVSVPSTEAVTLPLRSPGNIVGQQLGRGGGRGHNNVPRAAYGRYLYEEDGRSIEPYSSGSSTTLEYGRFNGHMSAPTSPFSSPINLSPRRDRGGGCGFTSQYVATPCFQVWSDPELISSSYSSNLGNLCSNHYVSVENDQRIVDGSPIQSPLISRCRSIRSSSRPLLDNTSFARRESHSPCFPNVHPLPLPPSTLTHCHLSHSSHILESVLVNSQWQKGKLIGRGTFGTVHVASNRETGASCAMKVVEMLPDDSNSAECIKQLEQEIKVLSNLKHPNIVQYYGSEIVGDQFNIYLEYVHPGSLTQFIKDHCGAITESVVRNFTRHILCGLAYLHSTNTIHRDIKGANLLVDAYGVVKLADFGMAKHLHGHKASLSLKGSPNWLAPELLHSGMCKDTSLDAAYAVDIWSLGCTVIEMLTGAPPWSEYEGAAAMYMVLKESPPFPDGLSEDGQDFLNQCFRRNPTERPTAVMLLEHRFMRGNHLAPDTPSKRPSVVKDSLLSRRGHRVPMFSDSQIMQGKSVAEPHNEVSHQCSSKGPNTRMALHYSPRSILEGLPCLSPPNAGYEHLRSPVGHNDHKTKKP